MRLKPLNPTPELLATLSLVCVLFDAALFLSPAPSGIHPSGVVIILGMALFLLCLGIPLWALSHIKTGVRLDRWPEAQLARLRRITLSTLYTRLIFLLLAGFFIFSVFNLLKDIHAQINWAAYLVSMYLMQLRSAVKPYTPSNFAAHRIDWNNVPRLQSTHWGER